MSIQSSPSRVLPKRLNVCCVICYLSLDAVKNLKDAISSTSPRQPVDKDSLPSLPVQSSTEDRLQSNLVLIEGQTVHSVTRNGIEVHYISHNRSTSQQACLLTQLKYRGPRHLDWFELFSIPGHSKCIPYNEADTRNLGLDKETWTDVGKLVCAYKIGSNGRPLVAHASCWELLQTYAWSLHRKSISPYVFWDGASKARVDKQQSMPHSSQHIQLPWGIPEGIFQNDNDEELTIKWSRQLEEIHKGCDAQASLDVIWTLMKAWVYFPISNFPVSEAFYEIAIATPNDTSSRIESQDNTPGLLLLPVEILSETFKLVDSTKTALRISATCKRLRAIILPHLDSIASLELHEQYQWCLPMTPLEKAEWKEVCRRYAVLVNVKGKLSWHHTRQFPWLAYMKQCLKSDCWAMINRRRVIDNIKVICEGLNARGLLKA